MKRLREVFRSEAGFTLVELLVVIAVLGILAGIAVPRLTGVQDKAIYATGKSALGTINTTMGLYYAENNTYPVGDAAQLATDLGTYVDNYGDLISGWTVTYDDETTGDSTDTFVITLTNVKDNTITLTLDETGSIDEG